MTSKNVDSGAADATPHIENEAPRFDTPGVGELQDVHPDDAQAALTELGVDARQPDDHPYDASGDPDAHYTRREQEDSRLGKIQPSADGRHFDALRAEGRDSASLDSGLPASAPRAGG